MPRLNCTYREFIEIISRYGFILHRHDGGSHQIWRGEISGVPRLVTIAGHRPNEPIPIGTLATMIRQSGLDQKLFRK